MERVSLDGVELEYEVVGTGEPVLLIHGSVIAEGFTPVMTMPELADRYQLIRYHRRGFAGSTHPLEPISMSDQARDAAGLLHALGVAKAHVIGHSYGGDIALQLGLDSPMLVHSLVLAEPAVMAVPAAGAAMEALGPIFETYAAGEKAAAVGAFLAWVSGRPNYEAIVEAAVPGAMAQAVKDVDTFFAVEMPAIQEWRFGPAEGSRITAPALYVLGGDSVPMFGEGCEALQEWLPNLQVARVEHAAHLLQMEALDPVMLPVAAFLAAHPMP